MYVFIYASFHLLIHSHICTLIYVDMYVYINVHVYVKYTKCISTCTRVPESSFLDLSERSAPLQCGGRVELRSFSYTPKRPSLRGGVGSQ